MTTEDSYYTLEKYRGYVEWFEGEYPNDPMLHPAPYEFWVAWNKAMDAANTPHWFSKEQADYDAGIERAAEAEWTRCRSSADRKSGATWNGQTEGVKEAWRKGARNAVEAFFGG